MIISTAEELRAFLPNHVMDNIDSMAGFFNNSEHDFLAERIGAPLLKAVNEHYLDCGDAEKAEIAGIINAAEPDPWLLLISLCQRCVVFDAFARAADIQAISVNEAGLNVVDSNGYDNAPEKTIANYKSQLVKESHAASNRLLVQLEEWQKELSQTSSPSEPSQLPSPSPLSEIIALWKSSPYYYYADGLLFNTATAFNRYVDIYNSREKFIKLLPDIRYCQEVHLEAEIGIELLFDLIEKYRQGKLRAGMTDGSREDIIQSKAHTMLRRTLATMVEARNSMFSRKDARDEASGLMKLTLAFIRKNQTAFDKAAMKQSPLYDPALWPKEEEDEESSEPQANVRPCEKRKPVCHPHTVRGGHPGSDGMLITSII